MPQINKRKLCNKHSFYNSIDNPNGCPKCRRESNKQYDTNIRSKERKEIYNANEWKPSRELRLIKDEFLCIECKSKGILTKATEVHHIIELKDIPNLFTKDGKINRSNKYAMSLAFGLDNLESICHKHHMEHHKGK